MIFFEPQLSQLECEVKAACLSALQGGLERDHTGGTWEMDGSHSLSQLWVLSHAQLLHSALLGRSRPRPVLVLRF